MTFLPTSEIALNTMYKIIFVVEGQTERIFLEKFLWQYLPKKLSGMKFDIKYFQSKADNDLYSVTPDLKTKLDVVIYINDVHTGTRINSGLKAASKTGNYNAVIGLKDLYDGQRYNKNLGPKENRDRINKKIIELKEKYPELTFELTFAIMETEAWFLAEPSFLQKLDPKLTVDFINEQLKFNLDEIDPEEYFDHPKNDITNIFKLIDNLEYKTDESTITQICNNIDFEKLEKISPEKVASFNNLLKCIDKAIYEFEEEYILAKN